MERIYYQHIPEKNEIETCSILGVKIAAINMPWLMDFTKKYIDRLSGDYITVANVHTTVTAYDDEDYRAIQNGGIMAIPDGGPLSSIGRKRGFQRMERTTGPFYMEEVLRAGNGWKHYFYGSTPETLTKLKQTLDREFPQAVVVGMYSPPFRPMSEEEDKVVVDRINELSPDFVWVGLGAPKQEQWMAAHQGKVHGLMVGVGAAFDYYAGNISRAPQWMQKANLEWLYRLIQDPKRLFKRYFVTNTKFIWNAVLMRR